MHADLIAAIKAGRPRVHLVTVTLADYTIRWTDGGAVPWDAQVYAAHDATYGILESIGDITDGIDDDASPVTITILPPTLTSIADLTAADAQGGRVEIHLGATGSDGQLVSEPYRLYIGELDQPKLVNGLGRKLEYDVITGEARGLQPNEEQRQSDAFHKLRWPDEKGQEFATEGTKLAYWRADEPKQSIGFLRGRGTDDNKAIQFTYEPNAPLCFPFGTVGLSGEIRRQTGYGPTNRWFSVFATLAASGPVEELLAVYIDDELTTFDAYGRALDGDHLGEMWFEFLPGDQPSAALTSPTGTNSAGIPATGWTTDHKLSGAAAYCWTGKENSKESEFRGGVPKPVVKFKALKGWDPRVVGCAIDDPSTWVWIETGPIADLNWCIGRWEGAGVADPLSYGVPYDSVLVGGIGAPLDLIDVDAFTAAADIADANAWKVAANPYSDEDKNDVRADLLKAGGARPARKGGRLSCVPHGAISASVMTVTESDTAAPVQIALAPSRLDRKNTGIGEFWSPDHRYEMTPIQAITDAAWVAADGDRQTRGFSYRYVPGANQCAQLVYYDLAMDRQPASEVEFKPYMLQLEAGDCFTWDSAEYLLDGVKARVEKRVYSPASGLVKVSFRPEIDAMHAAAMAKVGVAPPASTAASPFLFVEPPSEVSADASGSTVTVFWRNPTSPIFASTIIYRADNSTDFADAVAVGYGGGEGLGALESFIDAPATSGTYQYWVTAVNLLAAESGPVGPDAAIVFDYRVTTGGNSRVTTTGDFRVLE